MPTRSLPLIGLLSAEFLSLLGNQIAAVTIPLLVLQFTDSPLAAGFAGAGNVLAVVAVAGWLLAPLTLPVETP